MTVVPRARLTPREQDLVEAILSALSNKAIADRLGVTEQTVKNTLSRLYKKLGVSSRLELVLLFDRQRGPEE